MTAPRGSRGRPSPEGRSASPGRGAVLVGLAVVAGIIGLQVVDDSAPQSSPAPVVTTAPAAGVTTTTPIAATSTTSAGKVRKNSEVKVRVYNASGIPGKAQAMTDKLKALGYNMLDAATLSSTVTGYVVECKTGFEKEAAVLASNGVQGGATVQAWPKKNLPAGANDANCIVILGKTQ